MEYIEKKDVAKKGESIGKLQDIVIELNNSLDMEVGGEIAEELSSLYDYILYMQTTQANINIEKEPLEGVLRVLNTLSMMVGKRPLSHSRILKTPELKMNE
jgi:flagellar protein FliS